MVSRSVTRASRVRDPAAADAGVRLNGQNHPQEEQEVSQGRGENQEVPLPPPPPPLGDLAQIIHNQTLILETLANALVNRQPREQTFNDKLTAFLRAKPPTFPDPATPWMQMIGSA